MFKTQRPSSASSVSTSFQVANLTINPDIATPNQQVNISVGVANVGDNTGTDSLSLKINDTSVETKTVPLSVNESETVTFNVNETNEGTFNATVGDIFGLFSVSSKPIPMPTTLGVGNMFISPIEAWPDQPINITVDVNNGGSTNISYRLPFIVDGQIAQSVLVQLGPGVKEKVTATITETDMGYYYVNVAGQTNTISIVQTGMHTLHYIANHPVPFTLDGVSHTTTYSELVAVGPHTLVTPDSVSLLVGGWGMVPFQFSGWGDGSSGLTKTINVQSEVYEIATYIHQGSCPALYIWNGTGYGYVADVSDGSGWLGYLEYFNPDGTAVYSYNYPYDYIKMDSTQLQPLNGIYNLKIAELADEIFYLDSAKIIAVDHPANTNVYSTTAHSSTTLLTLEQFTP